MPVSYSCALITGASSGLGEEFALQIASRVDTLVLAARRESLLNGVAERIRERHPQVRVVLFAIDLSESHGRERLLENLAEAGLVPDLLINNAGLGDYGEFVSADWSKLEVMLRVNIEALTHLTHVLVPGMIRGGRGAVVHVSSLASALPIPDFAVYAATKAYVTSFSEALRIELREHGISVLVICAGPVKTGFGEVARRGDGAAAMPTHKAFYVPKVQVVTESLAALDRDAARIYPGLRIRVAATTLRCLPMVLLRAVMSLRPRRG